MAAAVGDSRTLPYGLMLSRSLLDAPALDSRLRGNDDLGVVASGVDGGGGRVTNPPLQVGEGGFKGVGSVSCGAL